MKNKSNDTMNAWKNFSPAAFRSARLLAAAGLAVIFVQSSAMAGEVTLEDVYKATDLCYNAANSGKSEAKTLWLGVRE